MHTVLSFSEIHAQVTCEPSPSLEMRKADYRRMLAGPRVFRHGRWFSANMPPAELAIIDRMEMRRQERNRRQRVRMRAQREADAFDARVARLPPWMQARLYGRTATVTERDGWLIPVDYSRTYGRHAYGLPCPGRYQTDAFLDLMGKLILPSALQIGDSLFGDDFRRRWLGWRRLDEKQHARVAERARSLIPAVRSERESRHRLAAERRKVNRRATIAACPSADDLRVAWAFVREDPNGPLVLGGLLLDLECFVDNALVIQKHPDGGKIIARRGGIRAWLRRNCPELSCKYKTLMRHKSLAGKFRQAVEIPDPVPTSELIDGNLTADEIARAEVHEQPRPVGRGEEPADRFSWERSPWRYDADGRPYRGNARYLHTWTPSGGSHMLAPLLAAARQSAAEILATIGQNSREKTHLPVRRRRLTDLITAVEVAVKHREEWWRAQQ